MAAQVRLRRVASPPLSMHASPSLPDRMALPRLWPNLSAAARMQIAGTLAELMRRMQPCGGGFGREITRADRPEPR
jgi:hypothetical protein